MQMPSGLAPLPALLSKKQEWDRGCVSPLDPVRVGRCFFVPVCLVERVLLVGAGIAYCGVFF